MTIEAEKTVPYTLDKHHPYMVHDLTDGKRVRGVSLSADGKYVLVSYQITERGGNSRWQYELRDVAKGQLLASPSSNLRWMPRSSACLEEQREQGVRTLYKVNPLTGERTRWATGIPDGSYTVSSTEDFLIFSVREDGPKEDRDVFEVLEMDDRQPGWRSRNYLMMCSQASHSVSPSARRVSIWPTSRRTAANC